MQPLEPQNNNPESYSPSTNGTPQGQIITPTNGIPLPGQIPTAQPVANFDQPTVISPSQTQPAAMPQATLAQMQPSGLPLPTESAPTILQPTDMPMPTQFAPQPPTMAAPIVVGAPAAQSPGVQNQPYQPAPVGSQLSEPIPPASSTFAAPSYPTPQPTTYPSSPNKKKKLLAIGLVSVLVLAGAVFGVSKLLNKPITSDQRYQALTTISNISMEFGDASSALSYAKSSSDQTEITSKLTEADTKLAAAEKSYAELKKSNVLHDGNAKKSFDTASKKWSPAITFLHDQISDSKFTLAPVADFSASFKELINNPPTSPAEVKSFVEKFKSIVDSLNQKVSGLKLKDSDDQQQLTEIKSYLTQVSSVLSSALTNANTGNKDALSADLDKLDTLDANYSTKNDTIYSNSTKRINALDPSKEFDDLSKSIEDIKTSN